MSWSKIKKYCVGGEDKELNELMKQHDKEIQYKVVERFFERIQTLLIFNESIDLKQLTEIAMKLKNE